MRTTTKATRTEHQRRFTKLRIMAAKAVLSYLTEGYAIVSQSNACETVTLRHSTNGNYLMVRCGELGVYHFKNNRLLKIDTL